MAQGVDEVGLDPERERSLWEHQWCQLHLGTCNSVDVLLRRSGIFTQRLLVCPKCLGLLKKERPHAIRPARWARFECFEISAAERTNVRRVEYEVELEWVDVLLLRAKGYILQEVDSEVEGSGASDEAEGDEP